MVTVYSNQQEARQDAARRDLREKVLCLVVRGEELLVFGHAGLPQAGTQLPAGGVEAGERPEQAAVRELYEESALQLPGPRFLVSCRWEARLPGRLTCQVCHAYAFTAPPGLPDAWSHPADGHTFVYRWACLDAPGLDWEMDAALPYLSSVPAPLQETAHD
jgi:ADP-ribose pyrophosphatase YjhB (NUDIX family)